MKQLSNNKSMSIDILVCILNGFDDIYRYSYQLAVVCLSLFIQFNIFSNFLESIRRQLSINLSIVVNKTDRLSICFTIDKLTYCMTTIQRANVII
jgi:hypothetical protein